MADFKSPQSEASALVYKMLERSKNGKKELFSFGVKEAEKLIFSQRYVILLLWVIQEVRFVKNTSVLSGLNVKMLRVATTLGVTHF